MRRINPALIIAATMMCSAHSYAEGNNATMERPEKAEAMIRSIEALAGEARLHQRARQRLIDAGSLVEQRAAIIEFQAKCQKNGYSCIQPGDFDRITQAPGERDKGRNDSPSDSSTLQRYMGNSREGRAQRRNDSESRMALPSGLQFSSNITWLGHTRNTVTLRIDGQEVTAVMGQQILGTPYTVHEIRPNEIVLEKQDGSTRIVPVVWPSGTDGNGQQGSGFQQRRTPGSSTDSSMKLPLGRPPREG